MSSNSGNRAVSFRQCTPSSSDTLDVLNHLLVSSPRGPSGVRKPGGESWLDESVGVGVGVHPFHARRATATIVRWARAWCTRSTCFVEQTAKHWAEAVGGPPRPPSRTQPTTIQQQQLQQQQLQPEEGQNITVMLAVHSPCAGSPVRYAQSTRSIFSTTTTTTTTTTTISPHHKSESPPKEVPANPVDPVEDEWRRKLAVVQHLYRHKRKEFRAQFQKHEALIAAKSAELASLKRQVDADNSGCGGDAFATAQLRQSHRDRQKELVRLQKDRPKFAFTIPMFPVKELQSLRARLASVDSDSLVASLEGGGGGYISCVDGEEVEELHDEGLAAIPAPLITTLGSSLSASTLVGASTSLSSSSSSTMFPMLPSFRRSHRPAASQSSRSLKSVSARSNCSTSSGASSSSSSTAASTLPPPSSSRSGFDDEAEEDDHPNHYHHPNTPTASLLPHAHLPPPSPPPKSPLSPSRGSARSIENPGSPKILSSSSPRRSKAGEGGSSPRAVSHSSPHRVQPSLLPCISPKRAAKETPSFL